MTTYAIGDVHGMLGPLRRLLDIISADAATRGVARPRLVMLGDYIDRGPDSKGVLDLLSGVELEERFDPVLLLGNHDAMLLDAVLGRADANDIDVWLVRNGGAETLNSYGADPRHCEPFAFAKWASDWMPPSHLELLGSRLRLSHQQGDLFFCHAGIDPDQAIADQTPTTLLYGEQAMFDFDHDYLAADLRARLGARVVHGHWSVEAVDIWPHRINVDTGCGWQGSETLSAVAIDGEDVRVLSV